MEREKFEILVQEAISHIPKKFTRYLQNLAVIIDDKPTRETLARSGASPYSSILGLYHGVPFKHRGPYYGNLPPDVIIIYQQPIEKICRTDEEVKTKVKEVVLHEVGHYFGLSERELRNIED